MPIEQDALASDDPFVGRVIDGRYRVLEPIGSGGMGTVYLAEHILVRRKVAIKMLHMTLSAKSEAVTRFHREAVAAAAVGSPHIVDVLDMGRLDGHTHYIVMEHLDGPSLAQVLEKTYRLSMGRSLDIAIQMCEGLDAVHRAGIVHRDLKPENLMLLTRGAQRDFVKLLDFGICKVRNLDLSDGELLTKTGVALGTPHFMAPEQVNAVSDVDARVDVYAIGAILYCMLTGAHPFEGRSVPQLFMRICNDAPRPLLALRRALPAEIERIVLRAMAKARAERYDSAAELRDALADMLPEAVEADALEQQSVTQSGIVNASIAKTVSVRVRVQQDLTAPTLLPTRGSEVTSVPGARRPRVPAAVLAFATLSVLLGLIGVGIYALTSSASVAVSAPQPELAPHGLGRELPTAARVQEAVAVEEPSPKVDTLQTPAAPKRAGTPRAAAVNKRVPVAVETASPQDRSEDVPAAALASEPPVAPAGSEQAPPPKRKALSALAERPLLEVFANER